MSFPYHDRFWCEAADFLDKRTTRKDAILAPDIFWWRFHKIYRYLNTRLNPDFQYDWIVLHKGVINELPALFVIEAFSALIPVFANEVFVILGRGVPGAAVSAADPHLLSLTEQLPTLAQESKQCSPPAETQPVLPEPGAIFKFSALEPSEFGEAMDQFWLNGGYVYSTLRDKIYYAEIDRYIEKFVGNGEGQTILDLCCGAGRLSGIMSHRSRVIGVDISGVAIRMAEEKHLGKSTFEFRQMDAHALSMPEESFDVVLLIDSIEHVMDAERVFSEIRRVLKRGGRLMATVANRDSVNQILMTKLGHPEFVTNYQHVKEFSYRETLDLLARHQFELDRTAGIFLYPYWGVPGVDEVVRKITDDDPEFVELMRLLGERAGAEHAYCSVVLAHKKVPD
jgi:2-polyprenyl-3-methyl-5-hydroxy-6-metoxy-1,4-benzoquinol methylase